MSEARKPRNASAGERGLPWKPALAVLAALSLAVPGFAPAAEPSPAPERPTAFEASLTALRETLLAMERNLKSQVDAWPAREEDQLRELPVPPRVRQLQAEHAKLAGDKARMLARLEKEASTDLAPLLKTLADAPDPALIDALVPVAVSAGREDARTFDALVALSRAHSPCPAAVVDGLAELENDEAGKLLMKIGIKQRSLAALKAAGRRGEPAVLGNLIDLADGDDAPLAKLCLRAIEALEPPVGAGRERLERTTRSRMRELGSLDPMLRAVLRSNAPSVVRRDAVQLVASRLERVRSLDLKAALVVYLGLCRVGDYFPLLVALYRSTSVERVRLAVIAAAGNFGMQAGEFLVGELSDRENKLDTLRTCVHALGAARYRPAAPILVSLLGDPFMRRDAARALRRIAGQDFGDEEASWLRWLRAQPDAPPEARELGE
ncbi:MAG: hypothetical protein HY721_15495 [Planctomycetes bacterium]|nr:hypothetical protein [Planctomycetota bacterium]